MTDEELETMIGVTLNHAAGIPLSHATRLALVRQAMAQAVACLEDDPQRAVEILRAAIELAA